MDNLRKQIVNNTEPKRSFSIVVSDNKTRFKTWFKPPIQLDKKKDYEIALINLEIYYSFPNLDRSNNFLVIHPVQTHHGLTLLFQRVVITLKILFIQREMRKIITMIKQVIRFTLKYLRIPTH